MSIFHRRADSAESAETAAERKYLRRVRLALCVLSGMMLGFSFPPSAVGVLACFGLVPLLIVLSDIDGLPRAFRYSYVAFLVFHLITLNWTGGYAHARDGYMMLAGGLTMLLHPFFYFIPIGIYQLVRRHLGDAAALVALPFAWVGYEYSHSLSEWSFPWLTIGNSQTYDLARIQFISLTGVYGLSFWILLINVLAFVLYSRLAQWTWQTLSPRSLGLALLIVLVYFIPWIHGTAVLGSAPPSLPRAAPSIRVGMVQSNVDPWEKWKLSSAEAVELYLSSTDSLLRHGERPDLVLWPETAVPFYLLSEQNGVYLRGMKERIDRMEVAVLTGLPHAVFYDDPSQAPPSAKTTRSGVRYDSFNAAALIQPSVDSIPWYGKMKMVPIAERVPYADVFAFLDVLRWGVGIGGWQLGPDSTIFVESNTGTRFCTMICYESVYPGFVAAFVRNGAEFIAIITIDSWWNRMPGAFQHHQFAILRAVENRRWVARCAVGGISSFIDPYGRVHDRTELFTQALLERRIGRSDELTYYTRQGDWLGSACMFGAGMFLAAVAGQKFKTRRREQAWEPHS